MKTETDLYLLEQFINDNEGLDKLENQISGFNIFETLNIINTEIRHSNVLAWLLSPSENHSLGDLFLKIFLKKILIKYRDILPKSINFFTFEFLESTNIEVHREWNYIDILIQIDSDPKILIAIENKILSSEGNNQLIRYRETIEKYFSSYEKLQFFLTPDGKIPSEEDWIPLNYDIIYESLKILLEKNVSFKSDVNTFIEHYTSIIKRNIMSNPEIEDICKKIYTNHKQALDLIFQYKPDLELDVKNLILEKLRENEKIVIDTESKSVIRFTTNLFDSKFPKIGNDWTPSKRIVMFEIQNYYRRVDLKLFIGPGDPNIRNEYLAFFKGSTQFKLANRNFGKKWHAVYQHLILEKKQYEPAVLLEEIEEAILTKLDNFLKDELTKIEQFIAKLPDVV
ncbi:PDDEXK-like family protein [Leptospira kanakyensis]|uniref:PDDEXK-like family protein n=1 Tax=Leptospira kanakyensis TaxID=2484968 RepID=UPI00223DD2DC|nr:PD-(D/E)XK nuclease family protein [Leptospira kanakyensis]MCW7471748.1 PD-(D/E)XK nuclease family protein [Leptospira kanakyensis]